MSPKLSLFAKGRKDIFKILKKHSSATHPVIWIHCASLGEYEQGVPLMQAFKKTYPHYKLVVTFFSPSGYEMKKNSKLADLILYLPIDTQKNARHFVKLLKPKLAIFVKYEFWPNYFKALSELNIQILLVSAVFRKEQAFFKWYGGFIKNALQKVDYFFVQDTVSEDLLNKWGYTNVTLSGDTRFDRVAHQIEMDNHVDFISEFADDRLCVVFGSSWGEDEEVFVDFINQSSYKVCFIIAPHEIKESGIKSLQQKLTKKHVLFSEKGEKSLKNYTVFIMDTIGYLSRAYSYADIAYVGGAMGTSGLHNILEPATFGIPIVIGKNFEKFREAKQLQKLAGLFAVSNADEFISMMNKLIENEKFRKQTGMISGHFINSNTGATQLIMEYVDTLLNKGKP